MKKIVLFGDSLMAGLRNGDTSDYLDQVVLDTLTGMGYPDYTVVNLGRRGEGSSDGLKRIEDVVNENGDFVAILFGDNDAIKQKATKEEFGQNLAAMLDKLDPEKTIVLTPTYVNTEIKTIADNDRQQAYAAEAKKVAKEKGVWSIDLYHHMTTYPAPNEFLQNDGLHPSDEGYQFIGSLIARDIKNKLIGE